VDDESKQTKYEQQGEYETDDGTTRRPSNAEVKNGGVNPLLPHMPLWHYVIKHTDNSTFSLVFNYSSHMFATMESDVTVTRVFISPAMRVLAFIK
jgi:hypothetical protein